MANHDHLFMKIMKISRGCTLVVNSQGRPCMPLAAEQK